MAERVDALGADAHPIAQVKGQPRTPASRAAARFGNDGMLALVIETARAGKFLEAVNADEPLDENFHEFDEKAEFLDGNNQRVVLLAQVVFHELRGLPFHQLTLGGFGAALGFGAFRGDFIEFYAAIGTESGRGLRLAVSWSGVSRRGGSSSARRPQMSESRP